MILPDFDAQSLDSPSTIGYRKVKGALMTDILEHFTHDHGQSRPKIEAFSVVKGCESGVTLTERNIHIDLSPYAHLNVGETDSIVLSYIVVSEFGLELPND